MNKILPNKRPQTGWVGLLIAVALGWAAVSCEEQDLDRTFEGPYFVRFSDSTLTFKESRTQPVVIRVHNAGPVLSQPIRVNYTVTGSAREGRDYTLPDTKGTVIIPANKSFGEIPLKLINNANNILESQSLTFTLTSVEPSSLQVGFGKDNAVGRKFTLTIQDDCLFGGLYTGTQRFGTQTASVPNIEITSTDCKQYTLSNWNINSPLFNFNAVKPTLQFIDNGDNTLTIPPQASSELGSTDTLRGNGAWNPRDRRITLNLQAKIVLSATRDTTLIFTQTYIPQ
ncbi:hypothetical protein [Spirosoma utsteinense]|uniref:Calx-beta domain-containing protein n=1 Tax=Spirosoma utsteinense TaxID=2585773 RepID=A0ABR6W851_9BACT|nr:hypothetical protein [Spirosoma utsteinense]MBC3786139.1 hypothetical protein [Spirosoma utsteinense]MBC3792328.1 hypothetical protein [Spirosoma utsteinense]